MDLTKLSDSDLLALQSGDLTKLSDEGLNHLGNQQTQEKPKESGLFDNLSIKNIPQNAGNLLAGATRGAGSIGATILAPYDMAKDAIAGKGLSLESNHARRADMDAGLSAMGADTNSGLYQTGKIGGEIAGTAGVGGALANSLRAGVRAIPMTASMASKAVPYASKLANAIESGGFNLGNTGSTAANGATRLAGGAINSGVSTLATTGDPLEALKGAGIGMTMPAVVKSAGALGNAISRPFAGNSNELADKAINQYNIPLGSVDVGNSKMAKALRSLLNETPIVGRSGAVDAQNIKSAFNREIGKTFGADAPSLTPDVMQSAKQKLSDVYDNIYSNNTLKLNNGLSSDLKDISDEALKKLNPEQAATVERHIKNLTEKANNGVIDGEFANNWQSELRQVIDSETGLQKTILNKLRQKTLSAFNKGLSGDDAKLLANNNSQYKAYKTIEPLMVKGEAGVAGRDLGDVPVSLLPNQVAKQYGNNIANSPFNDLSRIGSKFIADRVEKTGGSARAMVQNSAIGAALAGGAYTNPMAAAITLPIATGVNKLMGSPELAKSLLAKSIAQPSTKNKMIADLIQQSATKSLPIMATQ